MKNKILIFSVLSLIIFLLISLISAEEINYTIDSTYEAVQVSSIKYEPYPANPGEYFNIWITANVYSNKYAKFEFVESFPFTLDNEEDLIKVYENVNGNILLHYKVRVDKNAVEGINELKLKVSSNKYSDTGVLTTLDIYVSNAQTDFDLVVQDSTSSEISLAIANTGKNTANSMIVRIPDQENYKVTGTNGQMVGNLESGDYTIVSFSVSSTSRDAGNLIIQIDYTDNIGERRSVTKEVSLSNSEVSASGNITGMAMGEMPSGNFQRKNSINWTYIIIPILILILIVGGFFGYKNKEKILELIKTRKKKKKVDEIPEWISSEQARDSSEINVKRKKNKEK